MAKERVTVCLSPFEEGKVHEAIAAAMAPWDYNRDDIPGPDWDCQWDRWVISGSGCEFPVLAGHESDPRLIRSHESFTGEIRDLPPSLCDGGPRALLDFDAARAPMAAEAERSWHAWHDFAVAYPPALPKDHFWQNLQADGGTPSPQRVWEEYVSQPAIRALHDHPDLRDRVGGDPVSSLGNDLAAYVARKVNDVLPTHALLTLDGRWLDTNSSVIRGWVNDYLDALPPDAVVVRVLYHG